MLNSAVLELSSSRRGESEGSDQAALRGSGDLCKIEYVQQLKQLKLKHEQNVNNESMRLREERTVMASQPTRLRKRRMGQGQGGGGLL